jgi:translation initiation factor eIF-2B subunit delta
MRLDESVHFLYRNFNHHLAASSTMSSQQNSPATSSRKDLSTEDAPGRGGKTKAQIRAENRERQEKQRAAKASATSKPAGGPSADPGANKAGAAAKPKQKKPAVPRLDDAHERRASAMSVNDQAQSTVAEVENKIRDLRIFSHFGARGHLGQKIKGEIHPSIIRLGLLFAEYKITGANARCIAALTAFKTVCTNS